MHFDVDHDTAHAKLLKRWCRILEPYASREAICNAAHDLSLRYNRPERAHHVLPHVDEMQEAITPFLPQLADYGEEPDTVELAIDGHDVIYEPKVGNDEANSGLWMRTTLSMLEVPGDAFIGLEEIIADTMHQKESRTLGGSLVCDADLMILGRSPERFAQFERDIRLEYQWVPEPIYRTERAKIMHGFLDRRRIYDTSAFHEPYDAQARENLTQLITNLTS